MNKLRKKIYITGGFNTISMGTGRKEFDPRKERPGIEYYLKEAGQGTLNQIGGAKNVDETVIGNFMASRYNKQANLAAFAPYIDEGLMFKPAIRVEGACGTGGLALLTGMKSILAETADVVLVVGVEVQNTVKAIYGADILAGAGWFKDRKNGHAYFFPGQFSNRAGRYFEKFGRERTRQAMSRWYRNAIENARLCPTAQEYQNTASDLETLGFTEPNPKSFVDYLNFFDCSKVSDGASSIAVVSEEGLQKLGISPNEVVEITGWAQMESDITKSPEDPTRLITSQHVIEKALQSANIKKEDLATIETHDCFTIAGIMAVEAFGFAGHGEGPDFVMAGSTTRSGMIPFNTTGGLIGWGHPVGATGVHQAITIWEQLTGKAGAAQIGNPDNKPFGMTLNMGGDDKTVVGLVYKR